ncbi:hypothetical protein K450DRAFT_224421 [Umbelopsis ramanniana AG]|uniref:UBA domain-containing protein n=1 Tax=Umbelopsis ramanniana AG TaxID=1314678 RepID=A0AAD5HID1_UMBRA|nr:uncharacterized protein K450DRAFT_224421 [Umbelopsis ramanniana AG]KAI8583143.1 hypothetical protein K450DRAFT_224421 [Umbelopsis ramanniana AG]
MFSWKKAPKEPQSAGRSGKSNSIDDMDFSDLLNDPVHLDGEDGADEMDPDLLSQLQELSTSSAPRKPKAKPKPVQGVDQVDIDSYARLAQDEEIEVDFDESDMNDPNLLSELSMLRDSGPEIATEAADEDLKAAKPLPLTGEEPQQSIAFKKVPMNDSHKTARSLPPNDEALQLMAMGFSQRQSIDALQRFDNDLERATNYLLDSPPPTAGDEDMVSDGFGRQEQVAEEGMRQEQSNQKNQDLIDTSTVDNSKIGFENNENTSMKPLEPTAWNASREGMSHEASIQKTIPAPTQMTYDTAQFEPERPAQTEPVATEEIGSEEDFMIKYEETDLSLLSQYATEYQKAAISAKRAGDKTSAIDLLRKSKAFTARKEELKELQSDDLPIEDDTLQLASEPSRNSGLQPQPDRTPSEPLPSQSNELQSPKSQPSGTPTPPLPAKDRMYEPPKEKPSPVQPDKGESGSHSDAPPPLAQVSPSSTAPLSQTSANQTPPSNLAAADSSEVQKMLETLIVRQKEYKQAAIHYKDLGNLVVAKEMIRVSKEVLQTAVAVKNKQLTAPKSIRNKIPPPPDMDLGSGKPRHVQEVELASSTGTLPDFAQLEKTLNYQVDVCHNLELQNRGKTGGSVKLGDAFKGLAKAFAADSVSLKSAENTNAPLPRFHYQNVTYAYRETHPDIGSNEMVINIKKATKLQSLETAAQDIEAYVQWDLGGWPPENVPQAHLGKGQTPSAPKGANPDFDFKTSIPITRHNRVFMRYLQRKKATFEVYHKRYSYGFLPRPLLLGKVTLEMNQLLNNATVGGVLEIMDQNKKKTGAMLHVEISLSEALMDTEIPTKQDKWLIIDEYNSNIYPLLASAQLIPQSMSNYQPTPIASPQVGTPPQPLTPTAPVTEDAVAKPTSPQPTSSKIDQTVANPPKAAATEEESEFEQAEAEFNDADSIVSNMVLENEIGLINSAIAACHGTVPEHLMDQKQALEIKMNMLVIQVQTGGLTIEQYLNNVRSRIEQDKKCALIFKRAGRLDLAKQALRRKKIAQDEVDEAEAAMAQQGEEDNDS